MNASRLPASSLLRPNMPELDSVRGIAALMVIVYHGMANSYGLHSSSRLVKVLLYASLPGWLGVNLFFVLSGFLITGILLGTRERADYYGRFYKRRALRILPPLVWTLVGVALVYRPSAPSMLAATFFLANLSTLVAVPVAYGPLWSLAVEEHFYVLWPFLARKLSTRAILWIAGGICVLTPPLRAVAFLLGVEDVHMRTWFVCDGLAAGAFLAALVRTDGVERRHVARLAVAALVVGLLMLAAGVPHGMLSRTNVVGAAFQVVPWQLMFVAFVAGALLLANSSWAWLTRLRVLRFYGYISYGLYLCHALIYSLYDKVAEVLSPGMAQRLAHQGIAAHQMLLRSGVTIVLATAFAWVSRRFYEDKFLQLKERPSRAASTAPAAAASEAGASTT